MKMPLDEIFKTHPAPWHYATSGGRVFMLDARNATVPLFTMLDAAVALTQSVKATVPA